VNGASNRRRAYRPYAAIRTLELGPRRRVLCRRSRVARSRRRRSCLPIARSKDGDVEKLREMLAAHPELVRQRGTNGNDLLGLAATAASFSCCWGTRPEAGAQCSSDRAGRPTPHPIIARRLRWLRCRARPFLVKKRLIASDPTMPSPMETQGRIWS